MQLALMGTLVIVGVGPARGQSAVDQLQPLIETSAHRLAVARQVALAKWDSHTPVEDAAREAEIIRSAGRDGESKRLDQAFVSTFFRAQIEANKLVQYSLLADWRRDGKAPSHAPIDLAATVRPRLDQLQKELIGELADTASVRASTTCPDDTAKAIGKYLVAHPHELGPLEAIALDRAMAASCPGG